ncbi:glycosyltransferase family 4 protein [Kumtagia ephedrae]|uniref:Glycosyl transferase n=1 Tax=Kumtagia ephedrae TaxID=2116701 RepID=A0A2P7S8M3_9HYPH|nr:glycosyltransferase family 4 protein [Mesorhizobium ephedrae]PSJ58781.1 glycosyl transferase [Mesorhizobium ephedrae]
MLQRLNRRRRRILMTVDAVGGVWQYALGLAAQLAEAGHTIIFAGLGPLPADGQRRQAEAVATVTWLQTPPDWMAAAEGELDGLPDELARLVRDHAADLVHLNAPAQAAGLSLPCPVVVVSHSCVVTWFRAVQGASPPAPWSWHKRRNRAGFRRADMAVAPSASHAAALTACYGDIQRLEVVHNAVAAFDCEAPRENDVFAAARWWDAGKNGQVLDAAAARTTWPILAAGPATGPNGDVFAFRHATSLGPLPHDETRRRMAAAGIFVSPSLYEPFGLAALEAAQAGTPLVLADIPTYREVWADAALFFPPRDASALADTLDCLARDAALRHSLGAAALRRAGRYTMAGQAAAMNAAYAEAAAIHAGSR